MTSFETLLLDAQLIRPGRWANRHPSAFSDDHFDQLKKDIADAGGNVQPIKVRSAPDGSYEVVFGHRRHRACLELGLPVVALVVTDLSDPKVWEEMERENRARANLSPYEQGLHYRRALDEGLFPSTRKLAQAIGVDISQAAKVISLARLPDWVISAFRSPRDIQVNWASELSAAVEKDPQGVLDRARDLAENRPHSQTPRQVFATLVGTNDGVEPFHTPVVVVTKSGAKATISSSARGLSVRITGAVDRAALLAALQKL